MLGDEARQSTSMERSGNVAEGGSKMSDRPWSITEMRKSSGNWSLASDSGMFHHLQEFSQSLLSQTHDIQEQVDQLVHETKMTNVRLSNTFNDFTTLANTQFMENRVYDEEVVQPVQNGGTGKTEDKEKSKEQREAELIPRIMEAITLGLNVFDSAYETLDMNIANSDSEDDEPVNKADIILEPRDPYLHRRLPCLIGSEDFHQLDDLGLSNLLVDEKEDSDSESENEGKKEVKEPSAKAVTNPVPVQVDDSDDESSDEELFTEPKRPTANQNGLLSSSEEDELTGDRSDVVVSNKVTGGDFTSELAARLGATAAGSSSSAAGEGSKRRSSIKKSSGVPAPAAKSKKTSRKPVADDDLFGAANDDDDDDDLFKPIGLFSSHATKGLFDKDDSGEGGGGLFDSSPSPQPGSRKSSDVSSTPQQAVKPQSSSGATTKQPNKAESTDVIKTSVAPARGLFDDDDDDDDDGDIFSSRSVTAPKKTNDAQSSSKDTSDSSRPSSGKSTDRPETKPAVNKPKLPAGAVSIFGGGDDQFKAAVVERKASMDDSSTSQGIATKLPPGGSSGAKSQKPSDTVVKQTVVSKSASKDSLFGDDDDDLFAPVVKPVGKPAGAPTSSKRGAGAKSKLSLFDDVEDSEDLFSTVSSSTTKKTVAAPLAPASIKVDAKLPQTTSKAQPVSNKGQGLSLTLPGDDDEDDDLFSVMTKAQDVTQKKKVIEKNAPLQIPEASKVPQPLVPDTTNAPKAASTKETGKPASKKPLSMFDDDDDDDLFAPSSKSSKPPPTQAKAAQPTVLVTDKKSKIGPSLFDDDLFFSDRDEGPVVDLFGGGQSPKASSSRMPPAMNTAKSNAAKTEAVKVETPKVQLPKEATVTEATKTQVVTTKDAAVNVNQSLSKEDSLDTIVNPVRPPESTKKVVAPALFGSQDDDDDEDLFSSTDVKPAKKLPAGVVSMFGNKQQDALKDAFKKRGIQAEEDAVLDDDVIFGDTAASHAPASSASSDSSARLKVAPPILASKSATMSKDVSNSLLDHADLFSSHSSSTTNNTTSARPRSTSIPANATSESVVNFDIPPQASTLSNNISKDRARIPGKRRPPTRKVSLDQDVSDLSVVDGLESRIPSGKPSSNTIPTPARPENSSSITFVTKRPSVSKDKAASNPFSLENDDDLFASPSKVSIPATVKKSDDKGSLKPDVSMAEKSDPKKEPISDSLSHDTDDLFSVKSALSSNLKTSGTDDDDLFSATKSLTAPSTKDIKHTAVVSAAIDRDDDMFSVKSKTPISTRLVGDDNSGNDDDDIFATSSKKSVAATDEGKDSKLFASGSALSDRKVVAVTADKKTSAVVIADVDDIFSSPVRVGAIAKAPSSKVGAISVVPDDDDIFADASIKKSSSDDIKPPEKPKVLDDDDDIFALKPALASTGHKVKESSAASTTTTTTTRTIRKKAATKDENLFTDKTDIFADLAPPKAKDKRSTKTDKALFVGGGGGEDEDIFASPAANKPKSSKTKTQSTTKAANSTTKRNDEPADIFDDPLNALQK